jgi:CubicO group peptidase (beta-lactamase class C family)
MAELLAAWTGNQSFGEVLVMKGGQLSTLKLQDLHDSMAAYVADRERPGMVTLISRGAETHVDAIGTQEFGGGTPMRRDTIFRIASLTKPIVGAAALKLIEEGKIKLDEPIDRLIPELANRRVLKRLDGPLDDTVPAKRPILVSDLLTMRMGMGAIMMQGDYPIQTAVMKAGVFVPFSNSTERNADAWIAKLAAFPLMDHPGEVWRYDTSITLLGALIERATGRSLADALAERIFRPLNMKDTGFMVPAEKLNRFPPCYQRNPQTGTMGVWDPSGPGSFFARMPGFPDGRGGLVSTADDYHAFTQMLMNKGRVGDRPLLSAKSVEAMMSNQIPAEVEARSPFTPGFWDKRGWGYAVSIIKKQHPGEPRGVGWDGGYGTCAYWDPQTGTSVTMLSQRLVESPAYSEVFHQFFDGAYAASSG